MAGGSVDDQGPAVTVCELGTLGVRRGEDWIPVHGGRASVVLGMLSLRRIGGVTTDELVEVAWSPGARPPSARQSLLNIVSRFRSVHGTDFIESTGHGYRLGSDVASDRERFATEVHAAIDSGDEPLATIGELDRALGRWRGEPWLGIDHPELFAPDRARLLEIRITADRARAALLTKLGRHHEAIPVLRAHVAKRPDDEFAWSELASNLEALGRRAEALRVLGEARRALGEIGLVSGPALDRTEGRLLGLEPDRERERRRPTSVRWRHHGPRSNLPSTSTSMFGRDEDVASVRTLLRQHRLVSLLGTAGAGKTRLALAVGVAEQRRWRDGVWLADLTKVEEGVDVGPAVAAALGLEVSSSEYVDEVVRYLSTRCLLLILDNCEHVIEASASLTERVLAAGGRVAILATSREWLEVAGERIYRVRPLDTEGPGSPAVQMFLDRAVATVPEFSAEERSLAAVAEVCRRLDGLPLAIELAASRVAAMSPELLVAGLDDRFRLLAPGRRRRRLETLETTLDWSYELLDQEERRVFRGLGVFAGTFDVTAVAAVCEVSRPTATDIVEALVGRSLVVRSDADHDRFRLLETLRAYALRQLDDDELETRRERHAAHFCDRARPDDFLHVHDRFRLARLRPDDANLQLAATWYGAHQQPDRVAEILHSVAPLDVTAAPALLEQVRDCLDSGPSASAADKLRMAQAYLELSVGNLPGFVQNCKALRASTDEAAQGIGSVMLSLVAGRHAPELANALVDRFVEAFASDAPYETRLMEVSWRCMAAASSNDLRTATELADEALRLYRGDYLPEEAQIALLISGVETWCSGDADRLGQALDLLEPVEHGDRRDFLLLEFASVLMALAIEGSAAAESVQRYVLDVVSGRMPMLETDALTLLAELAHREGDEEVAAELIHSTGAGRSPFSILIGHQIATRLGVQEEVEAEYAAHVDDPEWLTRRPAHALQRELRRRGWLMAGPPARSRD